MTGNGFKHGDDWGMVYDICFTHIISKHISQNYQHARLHGGKPLMDSQFAIFCPAATPATQQAPVSL